MSFSDVLAPIGAAANHVGEGLFLLVSTDRICALLATVITVTMGPEVLRGSQGRRLGTSTAPIGAASASAAAAATVVASMI